MGEVTKSPHVLKAGDVHFTSSQDKMLIVLYSSKTHGKESRPQKIKISALGSKNNRNRFLCPCASVSQCMRNRGNYDLPSEQFFVFRDKSPVTDEQFRTTLRQLLDRLGLDSSLYGVHSFRIGRTCDLEKLDCSVDKIKGLGRWRSNAVYQY